MNLLHSARTVGGWTGDLGVLVDDSLPPCARRIFEGMGVHVFNLSRDWVGLAYPCPDQQKTTTVHFGKLGLLTEQRYRAWRTLLYVDSDMEVVAPLADLLGRLPVEAPAAFVRVGNPSEHFYRESGRPVPAALQRRFPDRNRVHSTRVMAFQTRQLPSTDALHRTLLSLIQEALCYFDQMFEQGLLQLLFYSTLGDLDRAALDAQLLHFYHNQRPWTPAHPQFTRFASHYRTVTHDDTECWTLALRAELAARLA